jgi:hypothetical protein
MKLHLAFWLWQQDLQARPLKYLRTLRPRVYFGDTHALETHNELAAFALGAASVFTKIMGRSITAADLEQLIPLYDYVGNGFLVLEGLNDWHLVGVEQIADGEFAYPLIGRITVAEKFRQIHNHSITCPGCDYCPNFFRKIPATA